MKMTCGGVQREIPALALEMVLGVGVDLVATATVTVVAMTIDGGVAVALIGMNDRSELRELMKIPIGAEVRRHRPEKIEDLAAAVVGALTEMDLGVPIEASVVTAGSGVVLIAVETDSVTAEVIDSVTVVVVDSVTVVVTDLVTVVVIDSVTVEVTDLVTVVAINTATEAVTATVPALVVVATRGNEVQPCQILPREKSANLGATTGIEASTDIAGVGMSPRRGPGVKRCLPNLNGKSKLKLKLQLKLLLPDPS